MISDSKGNDSNDSVVVFSSVSISESVSVTTSVFISVVGLTATPRRFVPQLLQYLTVSASFSPQLKHFIAANLQLDLSRLCIFQRDVGILAWIHPQLKNHF